MSSSYKLQPSYGKQNVPVFKIRKEGPQHEIVDMIVDIMLEGDVDQSWLKGENHQILPTETQKNTCYALALLTKFDAIEDYAVALAKDILKRHLHFTRVTVGVRSRRWNRVVVQGRPHHHVFTSSPDPIKDTCNAQVSRNGKIVVKSGVKDMKIMKTTQSGFKGFIQDKYTNLQPVGAGGSSPDRILCTELEGTWTYERAPPGGYTRANKAILDTLLEMFGGPPDTGKFSHSLQETAYAAATEMLKRFPELSEVYLGTPNIHFYPYPLKQFHLDNPNVVFQSTDCHTTASGRIETTVKRAKAKM